MISASVCRKSLHRRIKRNVALNAWLLDASYFRMAVAIFNKTIKPAPVHTIKNVIMYPWYTVTQFCNRLGIE